MLIAAIGLVGVVGCAYWVMSGVTTEGTFRVQAPNLNTCPNCGATLDRKLDHCPQCQIRTSI